MKKACIPKVRHVICRVLLFSKRAKYKELKQLEMAATSASPFAFLHFQLLSCFPLYYLRSAHWPPCVLNLHLLLLSSALRVNASKATPM
jgi:hypothetical protein